MKSEPFLGFIQAIFLKIIPLSPDTISVFFGIAFKEPPQSPRFSLTRFGMIRIFLQRRSSPCSSCSVKVANSLKYPGSAEYRCLYRAILKMLGLHTNNVI